MALLLAVHFAKKPSVSGIVITQEVNVGPKIKQITSITYLCRVIWK